MRLRVGDVGWYTKLNLGTRVSLAPHMKLAAQRLAPFAHPWQSPVPGSASARQDLRFNPYSIVPHTHTQFRVPKGDLDFNVMGIGVVIRVMRGFAHDSIGLITDERG